ncbi:MAG: siroheme synthase CysG [Alphaproteobacteria bacterium]|jgi:uroporphyrin-III C-methyltransferase/precorrin-2 dehydrogenase/sirohydrochlorin ferrochelatase
MNNLPLFFAMKDRPVVIAGGGLQAARKADLMVRAGCIVTIHATALNEDLAQFVQAGKITHITRAVVAADFDDCVIAVGASDDMPVNEALHALATAAGVPVNVVDRPELCDFILPAVVDRSPLLIAVSSGGAAPLLTRILKARFETMIPAAYGRLAAFAGSYRNRVRTTVTKPENRLRFWDRFFDGPIAESLFSGQEDQAASLMDSMLAEAAKDENTGNDGEVFLVGAGPGDPDLLTFRALRLMQKADVVLYDRLIGDGILNLVRRDAERIYVGKLPKDHIVPQEDISEMLVRLAQAGKRVLRLKGGDPFMFGRGGEEIQALAEHGIPFQVIPGVTAATGSAAYAGIPLTHRDHAQSCVFVTGHAKDGEPDLNWTQLTQPNQTVVIYMGLTQLPGIVAGLIAHGARPDIPAAIVENGTQPGQKVTTSVLKDLPEAAKDACSPALIIIGDVVLLRDKLSWFKGETGAAAQSEIDRHRLKS